jgi:hypothetical protein
MMRLHHLIGMRYRPIIGLDSDCASPRHSLAVSAVVAVGEEIPGLIESLFVDIEDIRFVHGMAPTEVLVVSNGRKSRAEKRRTRDVPSLFAV